MCKISEKIALLQKNNGCTGMNDPPTQIENIEHFHNKKNTLPLILVIFLGQVLSFIKTEKKCVLKTLMWGVFKVLMKTN